MNDAHSEFALVYETHYRAIDAYCRRRVDADFVDDAAAETFVVAWRKIDMMPSGDEIRPWLYGIAYRVLLHSWRTSYRSRRLGERLKALQLVAPEQVEEVIVADYESRQIVRAASTLRQTDREILRLSLWEELSHSEIAVVLRIREDAVRQRLSRALKNLASEYNRLERRPVSELPAARRRGI